MPAANPFETEYKTLFDSCLIKPEKLAEINSTIDEMTAHQARYETVAALTGVPWYFIAIVHCMEASLSFSRHLHNGDPLTARTVHVPAGKPAKGNPPFSWEDSAVDALTIEGFTAKKDWSTTGMLFSFESYNGMGYRKHGVHSPYLWSFSNQYTKGKFTSDGRFDPNAVSKQMGAAVLLRRMSERGIAIRGTLDTISLIKQVGATVAFDPDHFNANAQQLQQLLNSTGLHLLVDGKAGRNTSDAYQIVSGKFLTGDPKAV